MNKHAVSHYNQWISDKPVGFQFTIYDLIDRLKAFSPRNVPSTASLGRLVKTNKRVAVVGHCYGVCLYEVVA